MRRGQAQPHQGPLTGRSIRELLFLEVNGCFRNAMRFTSLLQRRAAYRPYYLWPSPADNAPAPSRSALQPKSNVHRPRALENEVFSLLQHLR